MEKSKEALAELSNLHLHQAQPSRDSQRSEAATGRHGTPYSHRSSERHHREESASLRWTSPASSRHRKQPHPASDPSDQSPSPISEEKREGEGEGEGDAFDSSPFQALDREEGRSANQVLHFDDLAHISLSEQRARRDSSVLPGSALRSSRPEPKWFPDAAASSLGASLNAQFSQDQSSGDFSPWNRQVAASAAQEQPDPVNNLQAQLFSAAEANRKMAGFSHTIGASPAPRAEQQNQQYSYNRAGYVWEGVRFNRAQGPVARLCLAQGVLIKVRKYSFVLL